MNDPMFFKLVPFRDRLALNGFSREQIDTLFTEIHHRSTPRTWYPLYIADEAVKALGWNEEDRVRVMVTVRTIAQ